MAEKTRGHDRTRLWSAVVYPESAPEDWRQLLDDLHIEWAESPLHEFDTNLTGELKKPHWHLVFSFDGPKSFEQVKKITDELNAPIPQRCHSLKGAVRYFAHLDNPEKFQYDPSAIVAHGGFDLSAALAPSAGERHAMLAEMVAFCMEHDIDEFCDLYQYAMEHRFQDWFGVLCDSTFAIREYLRSVRFKKKGV